MIRPRSTAIMALSFCAACIAFVAIGPDRFWLLGGDPDLGPVAFETLRRRSTRNDALACPPAFCAARSDLTPPVYAVPAQQLRTAFATMIASEPRVVRVASDDAAMTERYVQRTEWLGFPDTIAVRFLDRPNETSTLALYSRSKFGEGDLGVNRARIERWLAKLSTIVGTR